MNTMNIPPENVTQVNSDVLYKRKTVTNPHLEPSRLSSISQFTLVTYNILAECHIPPPPNGATEDECLAYTRDIRHERLMEELRYLNGDLVCLQEVGPDYYTDYLLPNMQLLGYVGSYKKRLGDTPQTQEGVATFVRLARFDWVSSDPVSLRDSAEQDVYDAELDEETATAVRKYINKPDVVLIEHLVCRVTGKELILANVHVTWSHMKYPDVQALQIACAFRELLYRSNGGEKAHILCGDFNQPITYPGYSLASNGFLDKDQTQTLESIQKVRVPGKAEGDLRTMSDWRTERVLRKSQKRLLDKRQKRPQYTHLKKDKKTKQKAKEASLILE